MAINHRMWGYVQGETSRRSTNKYDPMKSEFNVHAQSLFFPGCFATNVIYIYIYTYIYIYVCIECIHVRTCKHNYAPSMDITSMLYSLYVSIYIYIHIFLYIFIKKGTYLAIFLPTGPAGTPHAISNSRLVIPESHGLSPVRWKRREWLDGWGLLGLSW